MDIKIISDGVRVKNAVMTRVKDDNDNVIYSVVHYNHEVLRVVNMKVISLFPVSQSTNRAISQALSYLGIDKSIFELSKDLGINRKELKRQFDHSGRKQEFSFTPRINRNELLKDFIPL